MKKEISMNSNHDLLLKHLETQVICTVPAHAYVLAPSTAFEIVLKNESEIREHVNMCNERGE